jgi:hypothetical protein
MRFCCTHKNDLRANLPQQNGRSDKHAILSRIFIDDEKKSLE